MPALRPETKDRRWPYSLTPPGDRERFEYAMAIRFVVRSWQSNRTAITKPASVLMPTPLDDAK